MRALLLVIAVLAAPHTAFSAELPIQACSVQIGEPPVFADGFESTPALWGDARSSGSFDLSVNVPGQGLRLFKVHVPVGLPFSHVPALLITLHGAAGAGNAPLAAAAMRDDWANTADLGGFIVLAPIASGANGGWVPSADYPALSAAMDLLIDDYAIDTRRVYLHGFSAGGHVAHQLGLYNTGVFAAYAVNAGALAALAGNQAPFNAARKIPVLALVGDFDSLLPFVQNDRTAFLAAGWTEPNDYRLDVFSGGHEFPPAQTSDIWAFLCRRALPE